jgi:hypothetical protein
VILGENAQILGVGTIITNNITRLLPIMEAITGNCTISNITLDKTYKFYGNITLENSNITSTDNINYGLLNLVNTNVQTDEESNWITNCGVIVIDENSTTTGNIINYGEVFNGTLPEDFSYDPTHHIINNDTINIYFDTNNGNTLSDIVNEGDTLDFQGTISHITGLDSLVINKPVNIITSTNDGRIEDFESITYSNGASGSNITGLYTYNTQFYVKNAHNMVFDNISNVVNSKIVGAHVGQTSIRENSTNITVKNSYFYTKDNGGSSTFVFGWADNCTLVNSTIETDGMVGNLVYLTTYNVEVPDEVIPNSNNQILNNVIIGPDDNSPICWSIVLTGANNTIANNVIYYRGEGIVQQYGSEVALLRNNTVINNTHIKSRPYNELIVDTTEFTIGETATIQASIYYATKINTNITKGKITFKVNGKTLKDENGKVIYAKVVNGTTTIENYIVPEDWAKEGTVIQAVYSGSIQCAKLTSEKTNITVTTEELTLTTTATQAAPGQTTTLTATLSDNTINTGKIVFKINGKTVKDANGKVIYAKIVNGTVSVDYTLPETYKAGNYTVTATFIASGYDRIEATETLTVTA